MKKIAVFDNNDDLCEIITRILEDEGYSTIKVQNVNDLIEKINTFHNDLELLLLDSIMPMNVVNESIRNHNNIKIIYMGESRHLDFEDNDTFYHENEVGYIQKPFERIELLDKIRQLMDN